MAISKKNKNSINLIDPVYTENDAFAKAYEWMVTIGKYLLIFVEMIVLGVFFSRFILDERNNDLTEEINSQISLLNDSTWKQNNRIYSNYQTLLSDVEIVRMGQRFNSEVVSEVTSSVPSTIILNSFSLNGDRVSLSLTALNLEDINIYETALKSSTRYSDVSFNITKEDGEIKVGVTFNIVRESK